MASVKRKNISQANLSFPRQNRSNKRFLPTEKGTALAAHSESCAETGVLFCTEGSIRVMFEDRLAPGNREY